MERDPTGCNCYLGKPVLMTVDEAIARIREHYAGKMRNQFREHSDAIFSGINPIDNGRLKRYMESYCEEQGIGPKSDEAAAEASAYIKRHRERLADASRFFELYGRGFDNGEPRMRKFTETDLEHYIAFSLSKEITPFGKTEDGQVDTSRYDFHTVTKNSYLDGLEFYLVPVVLVFVPVLVPLLPAFP